MSYGSVGDQRDFSALVAAAEPFDPKQSPRPVRIPLEAQSYSFELDSDLIKLVTLMPGPDGLGVNVRYGTDTVLDAALALIPAEACPSIVADAHGLIIEWREPLVPWLGWPMLRRRKRF